MATAEEFDLLIADAKAKRHALATGAMEVSVTMSNGSSVRFREIDKTTLDRYITQLEQQKAALTGVRRRRTFRVYQSGTGYY